MFARISFAAGSERKIVDMNREQIMRRRCGLNSTSLGPGRMRSSRGTASSARLHAAGFAKSPSIRDSGAWSSSSPRGAGRLVRLDSCAGDSLPQEYNADGPVGDMPADSLPRGVAVPARPLDPSSGDKRRRDHEYETLGSGGFGVVKKSLYGGVPAAFKFAHDLASGTLEAEASFHGMLVHPNIVRLLGVAPAASPGEARPLVMELMAEDLHRLLNRIGRPLSHRETRHVFVGVARALRYMHDLGFTHLDTKCVCALYAGGALVRRHTLPCPAPGLRTCWSTLRSESN